MRLSHTLNILSSSLHLSHLRVLPATTISYSTREKHTSCQQSGLKNTIILPKAMRPFSLLRDLEIFKIANIKKVVNLFNFLIIYSISLSQSRFLEDGSPCPFTFLVKIMVIR